MYKALTKKEMKYEERRKLDRKVAGSSLDKAKRAEQFEKSHSKQNEKKNINRTRNNSRRFASMLADENIDLNSFCGCNLEEVEKLCV